MGDTAATSRISFGEPVKKALGRMTVSSLSLALVEMPPYVLEE
jgi:hypothetical protein